MGYQVVELLEKFNTPEQELGYRSVFYVAYTDPHGDRFISPPVDPNWTEPLRNSDVALFGKIVEQIHAPVRVKVLGQLADDAGFGYFKPELDQLAAERGLCHDGWQAWELELAAA